MYIIFLAAYAGKMKVIPLFDGGGRAILIHWRASSENSAGFLQAAGPNTRNT